MAGRGRMLLTVVVAAFLLGLTACGSGTTGKAGAHLAGASGGSPAGSAPPASSLTETGSTLLFPLMQTWAVIGAGPGSSAAGYIQLESDISRAIVDDLSTFQSNATAGASAFGALEGVVIIAALLMAGGCARGLGRRIGEYR